MQPGILRTRFLKAAKGLMGRVCSKQNVFIQFKIKKHGSNKNPHRQFSGYFI